MCSLLYWQGYQWKIKSQTVLCSFGSYQSHSTVLVQSVTPKGYSVFFQWQSGTLMSGEGGGQLLVAAADVTVLPFSRMTLVLKFNVSSCLLCMCDIFPSLSHIPRSSSSSHFLFLSLIPPKAIRCPQELMKRGREKHIHKDFFPHHLGLSYIDLHSFLW